MHMQVPQQAYRYSLLASTAMNFWKGGMIPLLPCSWNPPNWAFPAVWIPLKVMQSVSPLPVPWYFCTVYIGKQIRRLLWSYLEHLALQCHFAMLQAALWLIWKSAPANDKMPVALPIGIFLAHALLGNQVGSMMPNILSLRKGRSCCQGWHTTSKANLEFSASLF